MVRLHEEEGERDEGGGGGGGDPAGGGGGEVWPFSKFAKQKYIPL